MRKIGIFILLLVAFLVMLPAAVGTGGNVPYSETEGITLFDETSIAVGQEVPLTVLSVNPIPLKINHLYNVKMITTTLIAYFLSVSGIITAALNKRNRVFVPVKRRIQPLSGFA